MKLDIGTIRQICKENDINIILGYARGVLKCFTTPMLFESTEELDSMVFNSFCNHNLATYLLKAIEENSALKRLGKVGVFVKHCDVKSIVELIRENKIKREDIFTFLLPCSGIIDLKKTDALKECETECLMGVEYKDATAILKFENRTFEVDRRDILDDKCLSCSQNSELLCDYVCGKPDFHPAKDGALANKLDEIKNLTREEFVEMYKRCIRCGACKKVCPLCYCSNCVLDRDNSKLVGKNSNSKQNGIYLMVRAMHLAGRCVRCGRCSEVCPISIDHEAFHLALSKYIAETFDFKPGEKIDAAPVFSDAKMEEKKDFD